jgi:predicted dehydrogenase
MKKKIGLIGVGKMGILHGALFNRLPNVEVVAMADTSPFVVKIFRSVLPSVAFYSSYEKMLEEKRVDAVIISTPSFSHVPIALRAIAHDVDVFIEKPLSHTLVSAKDLHAAAKQRQIISMVGYCLRYIPTFAKAREMVQNGAIGKVVRVEADMFISDVLAPQHGWRYDPQKSGGGVVMDFGVHMIDLLYWFFGRPETVSATTKKLFSERVEDEATISFSFANALEAHMQTSWSSAEHRKSYSKMKIIGDAGEIIVTDQTLRITDAHGHVTDDSYAHMYRGYYFDIGGPHYSVQAQRFAEAIESRVNPEADLEAALVVQYLVDSIYRSAATRASVPLYL